MPTSNRRAFVPHAIKYFLRQDYPKRELVIVDSGSDPVADLIPYTSCIRYIRLERKPTLGAVRNIASEAAQGELIVVWDDDDWMASWRISYQATALLQSGADICGINRLCYFEPHTTTAWQYVYPEGYRPYVCDGTMCYTKDVWRKHSFPDIQQGSDLAFLWSDPPKQILPLEDYRFYIGILHPMNSSPKNVQGPYWHLYPVEGIQSLMGDDWASVLRTVV